MFKYMAISFVSLSLLVYCIGLGLLYFYQESLIFPADKLPPNYSFEFDIPVEEINVPVDGATLHALHLRQDKSKGLVFFLHGNAGNLKEWATDLDFYQRANYDLFIFDYRGYGKSTGKIQSQEQLLQDVRAAWDIIAPQYANQPIVIYGRSIGTALATDLAIQTHPELLVLVSPFSNLTAIAKSLYPLAPSWLLRYPLATDEIIHQLSSDIVFIHGDKDQFIPLSHSQKLHQLTQKSSSLFTIKGASHNDIHKFSAYYDTLIKVLP